MQPTARTLSANVGSTVRLECFVDADDDDARTVMLYNWYWRHAGDAGAPRSLAHIIDERIVNPSARVLSISDVEPSDAGEFTCRASTGSGQAEPVVYTLHVVGTHCILYIRVRMNTLFTVVRVPAACLPACAL